jgi:putative transposase
MVSHPVCDRRFQPGILAAVADNSLSGHRVARTPGQIAELRPGPCTPVSENYPELTSNAKLKWQQDQQVEWRYIAFGKPMQNGFVESFSSRLCDECLNGLIPREFATRSNTDLNVNRTDF